MIVSFLYDIIKHILTQKTKFILLTSQKKEVHMNKFAKFFGALRRNPNSKSAKAREAKRTLLVGKTIACFKCGKANQTLYKREIGGKLQYICKDCYSKTREYEREMDYKRCFDNF